MTEELARRGVDLVIVARDRGRLEALAEALRASYGVHVEVLAADLADPESCARVERRLNENPAVDLLVNNAGIGTFGSFGGAEIDSELPQVHVNVLAPVRLTHAALRQMVSRNRGSIITVSSLDAILPVPYHATYAATKAFVNSFTEGVRGELIASAVRMTTVMPGYVRTEFTDRAGLDKHLDSVPRILVLSPERVARESLDASAAGKRLIVPGAVYKVYVQALRFTPRILRDRLALHIVPPRARG